MPCTDFLLDLPGGLEVLITSDSERILRIAEGFSTYTGGFPEGQAGGRTHYPLIGDENLIFGFGQWVCVDSKRSVNIAITRNRIE